MARPNGISRLSRPERQQRGRLGVAVRDGGDAVVERARLVELMANRQIVEAAQRLVRARLVQGKSRFIDDIPTLSRIAALITPAPAEKIAAASTTAAISRRSEQIAPARTQR